MLCLISSVPRQGQREHELIFNMSMNINIQPSVAYYQLIKTPRVKTSHLTRDMAREHENKLSVEV